MMRWCLLFALLVGWTGAAADEQILRYDVEVEVRADGALDVTEHITVFAEGNQIRRGIYRDFPTRYRDRYGNRVVVDMDVLSVERNGQPEPWFTENVGNGVRINTGNDDFLPVPATHTFTLRYRTTRQIGFFENHDELYWNAIGTGWVFPVLESTVEARLPEAVPVGQMTAEAYTGVQGAKGQNYVAELPEAGVARWRLREALAPREGMTVVLTFPKNLIAQPSSLQRAVWLLKDNAGVLIAFAGLLLLIVYCVREWRRVGRDPRKGIIIARYEPPAGFSPASLRYMQRMSYDTRCFTAGVLHLAVYGCLRIVTEPKRFKDEWRLERAGGSAQAPDSAALFERLFRDEPTLLLKNVNASRVSGAMSAHGRALSVQMQHRYFRLNGWSIAKAVAIAVLSFVIALMVSRGAGILGIIAAGVLSVITLVIFSVLVRAPTVEGRKLLDEIEGLKLYLGVAERDELARVSGPGEPPQLDAQRYEALLPYAMALEVEEAWTKKFTLVVGAAAAAATASQIGWYRGGSVSDLNGLTRALGSSLNSQIASSARAPGSSSGSGGGGSSGGGGGGGGGGGR